MTILRAGSTLAVLGTLTLSTPATDAASDVTTFAAPDGGRPVVARSEPSGTIHLLYDTDGGPNYARSSDGGLTFGTPIPVVGVGSRAAGLEYSAWDMALGKSGRVHVAMGTNAWKLKLPRDQWGFFHARLDPGDAAFSPARNINRTPSEGFSIAADGRGNVTACWLSGRLYANVSRDDGETFGPVAEVDARFDPCNCCTTSAAYGEDGRLAILYREEADNERDMYLALWDQARGRVARSRVGLAPWKIDGCPMTYFAVTPDRGGFAAAWPTKGKVYFARLDGRGEPSGRPEIETPGSSGMRSGMVVLTAPDGSTLVGWKKGTRAGWQLYDGEGRPSGEPGFVEGRGGGLAGVVGKDGRFILFR